MLNFADLAIVDVIVIVDAIVIVDVFVIAPVIVDVHVHGNDTVIVIQPVDGSGATVVHISTDRE